VLRVVLIFLVDGIGVFDIFQRLVLSFLTWYVHLEISFSLRCVGRLLKPFQLWSV
jgi:hypothetical protein